MEANTMEPWLSVIGGGLAAALVTIVFSVLWDKQKQKQSEDWEYRRYQANQVHFASLGLAEVFFAAKTELYFLTATLETLAASLKQLESQADTIVRQQVGPELLEQRKAQLLQPFTTYNKQQVDLRWNQFEQKTKDLQAKAEAHINVLRPFVSLAVYDQILTLYAKFSGSWVWDLPHAKERLKLYEDTVPEVNRMRDQLAKQIEIKLGRVKPDAELSE